MKIVFTLEFNVEVGRGAYRSFIEDLRTRLAGGRESHDRPVLPPQARSPTEWFEIVLRTNHPHETRLLFRPDNLYLDAYKMENSQTWLEFSAPNQTRHLIPNSTLLGFDGSYIGTQGLENAAGRTRGSIRLCRDTFRNAVNYLATSNDGQERAESLLVVIQMLAESIRFEEITYFVLGNYIVGDTGRVPDERILELENSWGRISNALLRSDAHPDLSIFPLDFPERLRMNRAEQVAAAIGILLCNVKGIPPRGPRSLLAAASDAGRPLVEVFAVQINNIDDENPGDLYGTITVTDGLISQDIYNRDRDSYKSIKPGENALLTGPDARAISALDSFTIDVALMDRDSFPDPSPDDLISDGQIEWSVYHTTNEYDATISQKIDGEYGSATVVYAVLSNAVQATVEVTLIDEDEEKPANVYGTIAASNTKFSSDFESVLFRRNSGEYLDVGPWEVIRLSRSIVAVPLDSELIVRADLYDYDTLSPDDEIAKGTANFPAQLSGTSQQNISGEYGEIQVTVTWIP